MHRDSLAPRSVVFSVILLLVPLALAACGGGGSGGSSSPLAFPVSPAVDPFATSSDIVAPVYGFARIVGTEGVELDVATNQVLVAMEDSYTAGNLAGVAQWISDRGGRIVGQIPSLHLLQAELPFNTNVEQAIAALPDLPGVFLAFPNLVVSFLRAPIPDPRAAGEGWWIDAIEAPAAWDVTTGDPQAPVGLVDAGLDPTGHFLPGRITFVTQTDGDQSGHGTAVASLLAADGADGACAVGVAWENPIRVADVFLSSYGSVVVLDVIRGAELVMDSGARVVNLSIGPVLPNGELGTNENFLELRRAWREAVTPAVRYAAERDSLLVWSAGNSGQGQDVNHLPGESDYVAGTTVYDDDALLPPSVRNPGEKSVLWDGHALIVAGIAENLGLSAISDAGAVIALSAPGENVFLGGPNGTCTTGTGTSFSAPLVAGVAALVAARNPALTASQIRQILVTSAWVPPGWNSATGGSGIVDAKNAVLAAGGQ